MGHRGSGRYARGDNALGICERCSKKMLRRKMVYDGQYPDLLVCPDCWDPKHPQEYLPDVTDPITIYDPTGDPDRAQANILTIPLPGDQALGGPSGSNSSSPDDPLSESPIPPWPLPPQQQAQDQYTTVVTNPLQIDSVLGVSQFQSVPGQTEFPAAEIPPPQGGVVVTVAGARDTVDGVLLGSYYVSENDINTWNLRYMKSVNHDTTPEETGNFAGLVFNGTRWVGLCTFGGEAQIWTCDDSELLDSSRWTKRTIPSAFSTRVGEDMHIAGGKGYTNNRICALGNFVSFTCINMWSDDGINWTATASFSVSSITTSIRWRPRPDTGSEDEWWSSNGGTYEISTNNAVSFGATDSTTGRTSRDIGFGNVQDGFTFPRIVAPTTGASSGDRRIRTSDDNGATYQVKGTHIASQALYTCVMNPNTGTLIAMGSNGRISRSTDNGETWVDSTITGKDWTRVRYDNNSQAPYGFIAAGGFEPSSDYQRNLISSQDDGETWTVHFNLVNRTDQWLYRIASRDMYRG